MHYGWQYGILYREDDCFWVGIAREPNISLGNAHSTARGHLENRKICARRLPKNMCMWSHNLSCLTRYGYQREQFVAPNPKSTHRLPPQKQFKITATVFRDHRFMLMGLRNHNYNVTVHFRDYVRLFVAVGPSCCVKALPFCTKTGPILPIGLVTDTALRLTI